MSDHADLLATKVAGSRGGNDGYLADIEPDPMGVNVGFDDPYVLFSDPPQDEGSGSLLGGMGIPSNRCRLDGMPFDCGWASELMSTGGAVQCPNNDCGPKVGYDKNGWHFSSTGYFGSPTIDPTIFSIVRRFIDGKSGTPDRKSGFTPLHMPLGEHHFRPEGRRVKQSHLPSDTVSELLPFLAKDMQTPYSAFVIEDYSSNPLSLQLSPPLS